MTELVPREPGKIETTTWGEVDLGNIVRDKKDRLHTIVGDDDEGRVLLRSAHPEKEVWMRRPPADHPVDIYVPSEQEAIELLVNELGARLLRDIEEREHTIARPLTWKVEPVKADARALRDHIDMLHGVNVDDVLRRHAGGTKVNPTSRAAKAAALAELRDLHDEMHGDPQTWPQGFVHIHTLNPKEAP